MKNERQWLRSDSVELWTPESGKPFTPARKRFEPKKRHTPGPSGRGRRAFKMKVGE